MRLALLLPLWLAISVGEQSLVHQCHMHGTPGPVHSAAGSNAGHSGAGTEGHAHHAQAPDGDQDQPPQDSSHACTCIGTCTESVAIAVRTQGAVVAVELESPRQPVPPSVDSIQARRDAHRTLPFGNGPPRIRSSARV